MRITIIAIFLLVTACSPHNLFIMTNQVEATLTTDKHYAPHDRKVFMTEESLPLNAVYTEIASIEVGFAHSAPMDDVLRALAEKAREVGADGVIRVKTWKQPAGWSNFSPQASGTAIVIDDKETIDLASTQGSWQ